MEYPIELILSPQMSCGEGPVWDRERQKLYWSDSNGRSIYYYDYITRETILYYDGMHAASLARHKNGSLMVAGEAGFKELTEKKEIFSYNDCVNGVYAHHLNDMIADPYGRLFAGQEVFEEGKEYEPGYLFRLDTDGDLQVVDGGLHISNGMAFNADNSLFYLADTIQRKIFIYDYHGRTGDISNKKVLVEFDRDFGMPDGLIVDNEDFLWVAMILGNRILRIDPQGRVERQIILPFSQPTSLTFGGRDMNELFITSASMLWQTKLAPKDHSFSANRGGNLYKIYTDIQGKEDFRANTISFS